MTEQTTGAWVERTGALRGIRVLDLTRILSGPFASMILADLGADVIKVEDTRGGDDTRHWGPPFLGADAAYFHSVNRNKRSLSVDLKSEAGLDIVLRLADTADVVLENFRPGTAERLGLGYAALSARNPRLVYGSVSGYGHTGPLSKRAGYDAIAQAMSGAMSVTGVKDGEAVRFGIAGADLGAGMWVIIGILSALWSRESTGVGQHVDVSLLDGQVSWLTYVAQNYFASGVTPGRYGSAHPNIVPYQGFATNPGRVANRDVLLPLISAALTARSAAEWSDLLTEAGVPVGPINTVAEALELPQIRAREMVVDLPHTVEGSVRTLGSPIKLSSTPTTLRHASPTQGEHTTEVLAALGLSEDEIGRLLADGVVR